MAEKFKVNDRVKRIKGSGTQGTVMELRYEISTDRADNKEKAPMVVVHWDSGTISYFAPEALEAVA